MLSLNIQMYVSVQIKYSKLTHSLLIMTVDCHTLIRRHAKMYRAWQRCWLVQAEMSWDV